MRTNVSTDFANEIKGLLENYTDGMVDAIERILEEVGEDAVDDLKNIGEFKNRTGKYRKSWRVSKEQRRTYTNVTVYAREPHYRRTHLLEYGHYTRSGTRTRGFPHISTTNEKAQQNAVQRIIDEIQRM